MPQGGEGSKGGVVIGHTKSGKAIYKDTSHESHKTFKPDDHKNAANLHQDIYDRAQKKLHEKHQSDDNFKPSQKVFDFLQHHQRQSASHTSASQKPGQKPGDKKKKVDPEKEEKKKIDGKVDSKAQMSREMHVANINKLRAEGKTGEARRLYDKHVNPEGKGAYIKKAHSLLEALGKSENLEKAKYIRREGSPGNYKYIYTMTGTASPPKQELKEPERVNSLTPDTWLDEDWTIEGLNIGGKVSHIKYESPEQSTCNLVGRVGFGKTSRGNQRKLNRMLNAAEDILTDIGIKLKEPLDFTCQEVDVVDRESPATAVFSPNLVMDDGAYVNNRVTILSAGKSTSTAKSLFHEIGHAIDYDRSENGDQTFGYITHSNLLNKELDETVEELLDYVKHDTNFYNTEYSDEIHAYLNEPTERFARAFEVYAFAKLGEKVAAGKADPAILDGFTPDLLDNIDHEHDSPETREANKKVKNKIINDIGGMLDKIFALTKSIDLLNDLRKAKYTKREGSPGNYKYTYDEPQSGGHKQLLKEAFGKQITFSGPGGKEYTADVYGEPDEENKIILKFPSHGYRRVEIASINNPQVSEPGAIVQPKGITKYGSLGWPPSGFKEPEKKGNKTTEKLWYKLGTEDIEGRPSTTGKLSSAKNQYMSPVGSKCNLVGNVAFGKASDLAQRQLNQKLQMTEVLLTDMGIKLKTPMDFICQDMENGQRGVMAQFLPMNQHRNDKINLAKNLETVNKSLLHEIGHGIDYAMEQKGMAGSYFRGNPTELKGEIDELTNILKNSKFYEATGAKDAPGNIGDDLLEPDDRYSNYLKDQSEVFARAFEVYTLGHAQVMVDEGKLPQEYIDNFVPDYLKAGFTQKAIEPEAFDETMDAVTKIMDKIFRNRAIQKAMKQVDLLEVLRKNVVSTDDQGSATETGMYSNDLYSNASNPLMDIIKDALEDSEFSGDPVRIMIAPGTVFTCTKDTDGVYSGTVNRNNENVLKIEKQTLPTLLQMLKIKELIPVEVEEPKKEESGDYKLKVLDLLGKLL